MATTKKTDKKPAAEKSSAKKPAEKKPAAKPAEKKPAVKKTAAAKPAEKKTAAKPAEKKPAVKKTAAAKPAAKTSPQKKSAPEAAKKPVNAMMEEYKPAEELDPAVRYKDLFDAYKNMKLPFAHGYIISSFFSSTSAYSIYEIVSYAGVKEIFMSDNSLRFISGGKKLHILVEPATYHNKHVEPGSRVEGEKIPQRWNELETFIAKNQSRIMVAKEPIETTGSFTILRPQGINFAIVFYQLPDVYNTIARFFEESLNRFRKIPQHDARNAALYIANVLKKSMGFEGEYS